MFHSLLSAGAALRTDPPHRSRVRLGQFAALALCGFVTAIPLILFGESANKAGLFATGLIGYLSPTITLFLSIFVFREPFDLVQLAAFAIIWVGLGFFTYGELKE